MTWSKLSDDFADDCDTLSDAAFRLHVEGLIWSNRKLLDCRLPKHRLARFTTTPGAIGELLACGWWTDDGDAYVIRHHATYQRTREQVLKRQAVNVANGRRGGRPREQVADLQETHSVTQSPSDEETQGDRTGQDWKGSGEEQPPTNVYGIGSCVLCGNRERVGPDGLCSPCTVSRVAEAGRR